MANVSENTTKTVETTAWLQDSNSSVDNNNDNNKSPTNSNHGNVHPMLELGHDVSNVASSSQFLSCACGAFSFSLPHGHLK